MNQTVRRRRTKYADLEASIRELSVARDSLLDIVNALLTQQGGTAVIPAVEVQSSARKRVIVDIKPPDPNVAGSQARYVIRLEGAAHDERKDTPSAKTPSFLDRIGLWLPGGKPS